MSDEPTAAGLDQRSTDGYAFIGAVHRLVSSPSHATKADLLLSASCHALRTGGRPVFSVLATVNKIWPGSQTDQASVAHALDLGAELGLVRSVEGLDGQALWELTSNGVDDVDRQARWVLDLRDRAKEELRARARRDLDIEVADESAELWLEQLVDALIQGIQSSQDAYFGRVDQLAGRQLSPRGINQKRVIELLSNPRFDLVTSQFLQAAAVSAFDPLDPFGNELVSTITTGCVLHSYVAGRDSASVMTRLGSPKGQRALVDTPVLVDLLGPARIAQSAQVVLRAAVAAGWEVIVCEHSVDELTALLEREIPNVKAGFTEAHNKGVRREWYAALADGQLPAYCVEVLREGKYRNLDEMVDAAYGIASLLKTLGIEVRPHGNDKDPSLVDRCRSALQNQFSQGTHRSTTAIDRDANSMAVVMRRRRRQSGGQWPGGWIITPDAHIGPAYRELDPNDPVPLTLSTARWGTLLSATVPPAEVVELATAAASQLVEEAMLLLPSRFPSSVAIDLARQLSPAEGGSDLDIRMAQLTLDDSLDAAARRTPASLASKVLADRAKRTDELQHQGIARARRDADEAVRQREAARARAQEDSDRATSAIAQAGEAQQKVKDLENEVTWQRQRGRRLMVVSIVTTIAGAIAAFSFVVATPVWARVILSATAVLFAVAGFRWTQSKERHLLPVLIGAAVEVVGIATTAIELIRDLA